MSRPIVVIVCMTWLLRIVGALTAPTSMALTCRWRSRPQHQQQTHALQHDRRLFLRAALDLQAQTERPPRGGLSVSVSPTMYQGRYQNPYRGKPWGRSVRAAWLDVATPRFEV